MIIDRDADGFFKYLATAGFSCGVDERLRAYRVLAAANELNWNERLRTLWCPIFARSELDQLRFYEAFELFFSANTKYETPIAHIPESHPPVPVVPEKRAHLQFGRRWVLGFSIALALLIGLGLLLRLQPNQSGREPSVKVPHSNVSPLTTRRAQSNRTCEGFACLTKDVRVRLILSLLLLWILSSGVGRTRTWRRYKLIRRDRVRNAPFVWPLMRFETNLRLNESLVKQTAESMGLRFSRDTDTLDVQGTLDATIRAGGFPCFRFRSQKNTQDYLFLIEKRSPNDHFACWWEYLANRLRRLGVEISVYFYLGDLRRCYPQCREVGTSTQNLLDAFGRHTVILFGPGRDLLHQFSGELYGWIETSLTKRDHRALMQPRASFEWGPADHRVALAIPVLPARLKNLSAAVRDRGSLRMFQESAEMPSIPPVYFEEREEDANGAPPSFSMFLDQDVFQWLCACAVYPILQWELTLQLGLLVTHSSKDIFEENKLLQLIRVPWFREGKIPGPWRSWLIKMLDPETEVEVRGFLVEAMEANRAPRGTFARDQQDLQLAAQQFWLDQDNIQFRLKLNTIIESMPVVDVAEDFVIDKLRKSWGTRSQSDSRPSHKGVSSKVDRSPRQLIGSPKPVPRWAAFAAVVATYCLFLLLPERLAFLPAWVSLFAVLLLGLLSIVSQLLGRARLNHFFDLSLVGVISCGLVWQLGMLIEGIPAKKENPEELLLAGLVLSISNVLICACWYWHLDAGGPNERDLGRFVGEGAFLFPEMTLPANSELLRPYWRPKFLDYFFLAFNTSTVLSPSDTPVLLPWAKLLVIVQSSISLALRAIVIARCINIL